jgi:hypothetical protein
MAPPPGGIPGGAGIGPGPAVGMGPPGWGEICWRTILSKASLVPSPALLFTWRWILFKMSNPSRPSGVWEPARGTIISASRDMPRRISWALAMLPTGAAGAAIGAPEGGRFPLEGAAPGGGLPAPIEAGPAVAGSPRAVGPAEGVASSDAPSGILKTYSISWICVLCVVYVPLCVRSGWCVT